MTSGPPTRALHGPWPIEDVRKAAKENAVMQAISNGTCRCACCQHRGKCLELTTDWYWSRHATPKQLRARTLASIPMNKRPVWIFDGIGGVAR